jgi:hypothetical protein
MSETTQEQNGQPSATDPVATILKVFGPPPVLSSENPETYNHILRQLVEGHSPRDVIEQSYLWHVAVLIWEIVRLTRHKTLAIERRFRQRLASEADRTKLTAEGKQGLASGGAQTPKPANENERLEAIDDAFDSSSKKIFDILKRWPEEFDHARALESGFAYYAGLDRLLGEAIARRDDALSGLERYRDGLGSSLGKVADEIITVEYNEATTAPQDGAAPPLPPAAEAAP